jgi:hypothetical protein
LARECTSEGASLPIYSDEVSAIVQGEGVLEITKSKAVSGGGDGRGDGGAFT